MEQDKHKSPSHLTNCSLFNTITSNKAIEQPAEQTEG